MILIKEMKDFSTSNILMNRLSEVSKYKIWQEEVIKEIKSFFLELNNLEMFNVRDDTLYELTINILKDKKHDGKYISLRFDPKMTVDKKTSLIKPRVDVSAGKSHNMSFANTSVTFNKTAAMDDIKYTISDFMNLIIIKIAFLIEEIDHTI